MQLLKLVLKNIGIFHDKTIEFKPGLNLIYGPNGSGKTTIANSLFYCLSGYHLSHKGKPENIASYGSSHGTIGLFYQTNDDHYRIYRSTEKKLQVEQYVDTHWQILQDTSLMEKQGIFNRQRLAMIAFLREGEISEFLTKQPADRKDVLNTLLNIGDLLKAIDLFIEGRKRAKREEKTTLEYSKSIRVPNVDDKKKEIMAVEDRLKKLQKQEEDLMQNPLLKVNLQFLNKLKQDITQLQQQIEAKETEKKRLLANFENILTIEGMINEIESELKKADQQRLNATDLMSKKGELETKIAQIEENIQRLNQIKEGCVVCPTCGQTLTHEMVSSLLQQNQMAIPELTAELKNVKQEIAKISDGEPLINSLRERQFELRRRLEILRRIDNELSLLNNECTKAGESLKIEESKLEDANSILQVQDEYKRIKEEITLSHKRLIDLNKESVIIETKLMEVARVSERLKEDTRNKLKFEFAVTALENTRDYILQEVFYPSQKKLQEIIEEFGFFKGNQIDICSDYLLPKLKINGQWIDMLNLSGSEKMIIYLGMKVALAEYLSDLGVFVFDDPTLHLDLERKELLLQFIKRLAQKRQVIALTNDIYLFENVEEKERIKL